MNILTLDSGLYAKANELENEIFVFDKKFPDFLFKTSFDNYYFLWDSTSFKTLEVFNKIALPLMKNSNCKESILTSLLPHSDGNKLLKFKFDSTDSENDFNIAMNYDYVNINTIIDSIMFISQAPALYSTDKSWAIVGDSWDTDITVLGINNSLLPFIPIHQFCTLSTVEELLFYVDDENVKRGLLEKIQKNWGGR